MKVSMERAKDGYNSSSNAWDAMQPSYQCCGITGRDDWSGDVPSSCCLPNVTSVENCSSSVNNTFNTGCLDAFVEEFLPVINMMPGQGLPDISLITGLALALACLQLIGLLFGCCYGMCITETDANKC